MTGTKEETKRQETKKASVSANAKRVGKQHSQLTCSVHRIRIGAAAKSNAHEESPKLIDLCVRKAGVPQRKRAPPTHTPPRQGLFSPILPHSMRRRFKPVWLGILNSTMGKQSGFRFLLETIQYEATRRAIVLALFKNKSLMAYS